MNSKYRKFYELERNFIGFFSSSIYMLRHTHTHILFVLYVYIHFAYLHFLSINHHKI